MPFDDDDVVASRVFERDDGEIVLLLHRPQPHPKPDIDADPDDPPWRCFFTIRFPDGEVRRRSAVGSDSVQALLLAFAAASSAMRNLENGTPDKRPSVRWLGESDLGLTINHFE